MGFYAQIKFFCVSALFIKIGYAYKRKCNIPVSEKAQHKNILSNTILKKSTEITNICKENCVTTRSVQKV